MKRIIFLSLILLIFAISVQLSKDMPIARRRREVQILSPRYFTFSQENIKIEN